MLQFVQLQWSRGAIVFLGPPSLPSKIQSPAIWVCGVNPVDRTNGMSEIIVGFAIPDIYDILFIFVFCMINNNQLLVLSAFQYRIKTMVKLKQGIPVGQIEI